MDSPALTTPLLQPRSARPLPVALPTLSVVIVNYRDWHGTATLVRRLLKMSRACAEQVEVVVVDNHSPADRWMHRLRRWPRVSLRRWGRNRGFARAVNEGIRLSRGDWLLVLNPDVRLTPGFIDGALALAERLGREEPRAGVVGFGLHNADGTRQLSCGPFPTLASTLMRLLVPRSRRKYCPASPARLSQVPWATGCCLLLRRACVEAVGGFDPAFFLYYEDVDFCRRARAAGWTVWHEPRLRAVHDRPLHARTVKPAMRVLTRHALLTYAARHWRPWQLQTLAGIVRVEAWLRRGLARCRGHRDAARYFAQLGKLTREIGAGDPKQARRRLGKVVRRMEESACPVACPS